MYNLGILIYGFLIFIASFFNKKAYLRYKGQKKVFPFLKENINKESNYVWFHAASLGEFEQGRPVIEALRKKNPEYKILLTFFSPSGYEVRKNYQGADLICYLPLDTISNVKKFLKLTNPVCAIFIKYEFWPNFLFACLQKKIPTYVISANFRKNQAFFKWYGKPYCKVLKAFRCLFVQDQSSVDLLKSIGIEKVKIAGDTRFDRVAEIASQKKNLPIIEAFKNGEKIIIAGSSWPKDEELLIKYAKKEHCKIILAPHEIHESHLLGIEKIWNDSKSIVRYSEANEATIGKAQCLVINNFGLLSSIYQYADVVYIGGGFGVGIHNTLEAAVYGVPVVFGPNYTAFREARELIALGGAFSIQDYLSLETIFDKQLADSTVASKISADYVQNNIGGTQIIIDSIFK